jgi:cytoskeletal protein CcmA (bactofilin family)
MAIQNAKSAANSHGLSSVFSDFKIGVKIALGAHAVAPAERSSVDRHAATMAATPVSCIGASMAIVGNVECSGPAQVFGRIDGQLRATELVIGEGARVEGSIQAEEVTINGSVKGSIRAVRVS